MDDEVHSFFILNLDMHTGLQMFFDVSGQFLYLHPARGISSAG